jgi:sugar/nucleoside kinase (ribokinase family)
LELLGATSFLKLLPDDALLFANEKEAAVLTGVEGSAADLATALAGDGRQVVVTAGSGDAAWSDGTDSTTMAAEPLDRPELDTTGAGDAFAAGFLAARAREAVPAVCLRDGHALAAAACRTTGGRPET